MYNREKKAYRIDGVKIWVGTDLTGGNYDGAENIGTIKYETEIRIYEFSNLDVSGSSVQIQGGGGGLSLAEVEVYGRNTRDIGEFFNILLLLTTLQS